MLILYLYRILILPLKKNFSHRLPLRAAGEVVDELVWGLAYHTLPTAGTTLVLSWFLSLRSPCVFMNKINNLLTKLFTS